MSELPAIREAIGQLLDPVSTLKLVERYERSDIPSNQLPAATIFLLSIGRPDHDAGNSVPHFGVSDFKAEWRVNIRLGAPQPQYEIAAQQLFETIHTGIRAQLAANSGVLLTDTSGTTYLSLLTAGSLHVPTNAGDPFIAVFALTTLTLT